MTYWLKDMERYVAFCRALGDFHESFQTDCEEQWNGRSDTIQVGNKGSWLLVFDKDEIEVPGSHSDTDEPTPDFPEFADMGKDKIKRHVGAEIRKANSAMGFIHDVSGCTITDGLDASIAHRDIMMYLGDLCDCIQNLRALESMSRGLENT